MLSRRPLILFDFDGTLADSVPAVCTATNAVLIEHGHAPITPTETLEGMRYETTARITHHTGEADPETLNTIRASFYRELESHHASIALRQEMMELVEGLKARGWNTGIVSNNSGEAIRRVLTSGAGDHLFDVVIGEFDMERKKPDPEGLKTAMTRLGADSPNTVYIGDGEGDAEAANRRDFHVSSRMRENYGPSSIDGTR